MNRAIVNLTQHKATPEQIEYGVRDLPVDLYEELVVALTFDNLPKRGDLRGRALKIASLAITALGDAECAMIGGPQYLMPYLERSLQAKGITPLYEFTKSLRKVKARSDGTVEKTIIFQHQGFVEGL